VAAHPTPHADVAFLTQRIFGRVRGRGGRFGRHYRRWTISALCLHHLRAKKKDGIILPRRELVDMTRFAVSSRVTPPHTPLISTRQRSPTLLFPPLFSGCLYRDHRA